MKSREPTSQPKLQPEQSSKSKPELPISFWADLRQSIQKKRSEWRAKSRARLEKSFRSNRISQLPRGITPVIPTLPKSEALEQGFHALRSWAILIGISLLLLITGVQFGGRYGLVLGFIATLALNIWTLLIYPGRLIRQFSTWELSGRDAWGILEAVHSAAQSAHIHAPRVFLYDSDSFLSISIGVVPSRSYIFFSHGLVERLSKEELNFLISFETAKIASQWTANATIAMGMAELVSVRGFPFFTKLILRMARNPKLTFKLDEWTAAHGGSREKWAQTLWNLGSILAYGAERLPISHAGLQTLCVYEIFHKPKSPTSSGVLTHLTIPKYEHLFPGVRTRVGALIDRFPP